MPTHKLTDSERRELTLAALSGASPSKLANEYGVSRIYVHKLKGDARTSAEVEHEFWSEVLKLVRRGA